MSIATDISVGLEHFPLASDFTISRGSKSVATVVTARVTHDGITAQGECVPYPRYGESWDGVATAVRSALERADLDRCSRVAEAAVTAATRLLPAGAARNCVEAVCVDLFCKSRRVSPEEVYGLALADPVRTCATVSLADPEAMAREARGFAAFSTLKLKLDGDPDLTIARLAAIRAARPDAELIVDANEAWSVDTAAALCAAADRAGVTLIEQPLPAGADDALTGIKCAAVLCADESLHTRDDLAALANRYGAINIKLDKTGGLREALALARGARDLGLKIMVGSMVSTSLSMAPALLVAQGADWVDLDSPALLAADRTNALKLNGDILHPPPRSGDAPRIWG